MAVRARRADDGRMLRSALAVVVFAAVTAAASAGVSAAETTVFSEQVTRICAGALLFEGRHATGTRAGAVSVSRDIRETGLRRLRRVAGVPKPGSQVAAIGRWLEVERRLVRAYARDYLLIWDAIESADSPARRARLPARLHALVHEPDALKRQAGAFELKLGVPDCTGGS